MSRGIGKNVVVVVVIALLAVAGAVGYFVFSTSIPSSGTQTSTSMPTSSTGTTSLSTLSLSSSARQGQILIELGPNTIYLAPGGSENYSQVTVVPIATNGATQMKLTASGLPNGVIASLSPTLVDLTSGSQMVTLTLTADQSVSPGNYKFSINGVAGSTNESQQFQFNVAKYVVFMNFQTYLPNNMTVPAGSIVVFMNLEGRISQYDAGLHNIAFTSGATGQSPTLSQYQFWSYTFSQPGTYNFYCTFHPFMKATIIVTS